jgi:hypothetical protein
MRFWILNRTSFKSIRRSVWSIQSQTLSLINRWDDPNKYWLRNGHVVIQITILQFLLFNWPLLALNQNSDKNYQISIQITLLCSQYMYISPHFRTKFAPPCCYMNREFQSNQVHTFFCNWVYYIQSTPVITNSMGHLNIVRYIRSSLQAK